MSETKVHEITDLGDVLGSGERRRRDLARDLAELLVPREHTLEERVGDLEKNLKYLVLLGIGLFFGVLIGAAFAPSGN
jgi:hypothetical protein